MARLCHIDKQGIIFPKNNIAVYGVEEEDRLIRLVCPHCGKREYSTRSGLNECEITKNTFTLYVIEHPAD